MGLTLINFPSTGQIAFFSQSIKGGRTYSPLAVKCSTSVDVPVNYRVIYRLWTDSWTDSKAVELDIDMSID